MLSDYKKLKRLKHLQEKDEDEIRFEGFTQETLKETIKKTEDEMTHEFNAIGWLLVLFVVFPLALMQLGFSLDASAFISWTIGGIIVLIIIPRIRGHR